MSATWSLRKRLRLWFALSTFTLAAIMGGIGAWYLQNSVEREVKALLLEETEEFEALFLSNPTPKNAKRIATILSEHHPGVPMRWWMLDDSGAISFRFGTDAVSVPSIPHLPQTEWSASCPDSVQWRGRTLTNGGEIILALDAHALFVHAANYRLMAWLIAALALGAGLLLGEFVSRKITSMFNSIAEQVQSSETAASDPTKGLMTTQTLGERINLPSEVSEITETLRARLATIQDAERRHRMMIAGLAHEMGHPVQNMLTETDLLLVDEALASRHRTTLDTHRDDLRGLGTALRDLVSLCSGEIGSHTQVQKEDFDLAVSLAARLAGERRAAERKQIHLSTTQLGNLRYHGDKEAILRAIRNLVANAIAHTPENTTVSLHLEGTKDALLIRVDDEGPGVPEDERESIFEPLFRGTHARGKRPGYGLGLALSQAAAMRHKGELSVTDGARGGASFRLVLPRKE